MTMPEFVAPSNVPPAKPAIAPNNLRVKQPKPGPDETCVEYVDPQKKLTCGKPATAYVSVSGTDALPKGVRVALCEEHRTLHDGRNAQKRRR